MSISEQCSLVTYCSSQQVGLKVADQLLSRLLTQRDKEHSITYLTYKHPSTRQLSCLMDVLLCYHINQLRFMQHLSKEHWCMLLIQKDISKRSRNQYICLIDCCVALVYVDTSMWSYFHPTYIISCVLIKLQVNELALVLNRCTASSKATNK